MGATWQWVVETFEIDFLLSICTKMMRLLNTGTKELRDFQLDTVPPYLILSHRWEEDEVSYKDITKPNRRPSKLNGWAKLRSFCCLAEEDGWEWVWMDTCCIDRGNMNEVSEAINSMYLWYRDAREVYILTLLNNSSCQSSRPLS